MVYNSIFGGTSTNRTSQAFGAGHSVHSDYGGFPGGNPSSDGGAPVTVTVVRVAGLTGGNAGMSYLGAGNFRVTCTSTGSTMNFGRLNDNGVDTIDDSGGGAYSPRGGLVGNYDWATVPQAPTMISTIPGPGVGQITVTFAANDDGGSAVDHWDLQYDTNPSFATAGVTAGGFPYTIFTATPGTTWYFRVRGHNGVGNGGWSATGTSTTKTTAGGRRFDGSAETPLSISRRFNGSSFVDLSIRRRFNGSSFVDISN